MRSVYDGLSAMATEGILVFPEAVFKELQLRTNPSSAPDLPLQWATENRGHATRFKPAIDFWKRVMTEVPDVIDPDKIGEDEADPHILALSLYLGEAGFDVTVVAEDRKDRPDKISLNSACGVMRVPCLPVRIFLKRSRIWPIAGNT